MSTEDTHRLVQIMRTGAWLSVLPSTKNGIDLGSQELRYYLFLGYGIDPPDLPEHCNGCGAEFFIWNYFNWKKGGLITARHNKLQDEAPHLASKSFTPTHVGDDPKIYTGCAVRGGKYKTKGYPLQDVKELKGDLLIRYIWMEGTDSICNMRFMNTDKNSQQSKYLEKCLENAVKEKKNKYLDACLKHSRQFTPFSISVNSLLGVKAEKTLKCIDIRLAIKWKESYSHTFRQVKSRIAIILARVAHRCIWGARFPASWISVQLTQWEDDAGIHFFRKKKGERTALIRLCLPISLSLQVLIRKKVIRWLGYFLRTRLLSGLGRRISSEEG